MTKTLDVAALIELEQLHAKRETEKLANHPMIYLKPEWAIALSQDPEDDIRCTLARNPALAHLPDVVEVLSKDHEKYVLLALTSNPAIAQHPEIENASWSEILTMSISPDRASFAPELEAAIGLREACAKDAFFQEMSLLNNSTLNRSPRYSDKEFEALEDLVGVLYERKEALNPPTGTVEEVKKVQPQADPPKSRLVENLIKRRTAVDNQTPTPTVDEFSSHIPNNPRSPNLN